jgi:hypothetical protein
MEARVSAVLSLRSGDDGTIAMKILPDDEECFLVDDTALTLTLWHESADVVRARVVHPHSGAFAYFQSVEGGPRMLAAAVHFLRRVRRRDGDSAE